MTSADFQTLLPEIVLAGYAMAALMVAVYTTKDKLAPALVWATAGLFVAWRFTSALAARGSGWSSTASSSTTPSPASPR
jgi:hypothetical protein